MSTSQSKPEGNILAITANVNGTHTIKIDNGPTKVISIVTNSELLGDLLSADLAAIREHLMTRKPGHFRRKP